MSHKPKIQAIRQIARTKLFHIEEADLLFSNGDFKNKPYWDFKVDNTLDCYIEAYLDIDKKVSGCIVVLLGFQK